LGSNFNKIIDIVMGRLGPHGMERLGPHAESQLLGASQNLNLLGTINMPLMRSSWTDLNNHVWIEGQTSARSLVGVQLISLTTGAARG